MFAHGLPIIDSGFEKSRTCARARVSHNRSNNAAPLRNGAPGAPLQVGSISTNGIDVMADKFAGILLRGLIAGVIGAWTMDRATWLLQDREPRKALDQERRAWRDGLDVSHALGHKLTSTAGIGGDHHQPSALGMTTHYLLSIVPATLYAAMRERDLRYSEDFGLLYGLLIFLLWDEGVAPAAGISGGPSEYPWQAHGRGLVGHLALGIATHAALTALERDFDRRPIGSHAGA